MSSQQLLKYEDIKALSILEMQNDGKGFNLKIDVLREIFLQVPKTPVTIISIAGALRGGKSFLLNMLLHNLFKQKFADLFGVNADKILDIFKSRNGSSRQTVGINITNKPIMLQDKNEKEVAVFLLDTEGLFDKTRNAKECSTIFAMSALLSSMQIYNVSANLKESDLQFFQNFCNYTMATNKEATGSSVDASAQFQILMFLIRNWQNTTDHKYGSEGGKNYLDEIFETDAKENQLVRKQIKTGFSQVNCFLMPSPGYKVAESHGTDISCSDVRPEFLEQITELSEQLFCKENVTALTLKGITITGQGFVDLALMYAEILHSGKMPQAESISKANCWVLILNSIGEIEKDYSASMEKKVGDVYIKPKNLEALHDQCLESATQEFDKLMQQNLSCVESNKDRIDLYRKQMLGNLSVKFANLQSQNNLKEIHLKVEINACSESASRLHKEELEQFSAGHYLEDLSEPKLIAKHRALEEFKVKTKDFDKELVVLCEDTLQMEIESNYNEFREKNQQRLETVRANLKSLVSISEAKYIEIMDKGIKKENVNFEELHEVAFAESVQAFEDSDVGNGSHYGPVHLEQLKDKLRDNAERYRKICKYEEGELSNLVMKAENIYKGCIGQIKHDTYLEKNVIEMNHEISKNKAMQVVRDLQQQPRKQPLVQKCKESIKEKLDGHLELLQKRNEVLQVKAAMKFRECRQRLVRELFEEAFNDVLEKYVDDEELSEDLEKAKKRALKEYHEHKTPPDEEFKVNEQELLEDIKEQIDSINEINRKNKEKIVEKLEKFHQMILIDFSDVIIQITADRYANAEEKIKLRDTFEQLVTKELKNAIPFENIRENAITKFTANLNATWESSAADITLAQFLGGCVVQGGLDGAKAGTMVCGVVGAGVFGVLGLLGGGIAGLGKATLSFNPDVSVQQLPSVKYLRSCFLGMCKVEPEHESSCPSVSFFDTQHSAENGSECRAICLTRESI